MINMQEDVPFVVRLIRSWNQDPMFTTLLRGRVLEAKETEGGIVVSWQDGASHRFFVMKRQTALEEGWSDMLTDLMETLARPLPN